MAILENKAKTIFIFLQIYGNIKNKVSDELEYLCELTINTTYLDLSTKQNELCYITESQINYVKNYLHNFNYDKFHNEEEIFSFYPITMFLLIDFLKQNDNSIYVSLKSPIEIFHLQKQGEYKIGFDFEITLASFLNFFNQLIDETSKQA